MTLSIRAKRRAAVMLRIARELPVIVATLPLRLDSRANGRGAWRNHSHTHAAQRRLAAMVLTKHRTKLKAELRNGVLPVRLVRIAPRELDDDNLEAAFKSVRDGIADLLGLDDRDPRVAYVPDGETAGVREFGIRLEFYRGAELAEVAS